MEKDMSVSAPTEKHPQLYVSRDSVTVLDTDDDDLRASKESFIMDTRLFHRAGWDVVVGEVFDDENPFALGIHADSIGRKRLDEDAKELGVDMPEVFETPEAILQSEGPLVVKWNTKHRGRGKILLETREDKIKYIAAAYVNWEKVFDKDSLKRRNKEELDRKITEILGKVGQGDFSDELFQKTTEDGRQGVFSSMDAIVEKFIEVPGDNRASFRIMVDGYGNILYGLMYFSRFNKSQRKARYRDMDTNHKSLQKGLLTPVEMTLRQLVSSPDAFAPSGNPYREFLDDPKRDAMQLLSNPQSLLFINTPDITSNRYTGFRKIKLNGKRVFSPTKRAVLKAHGIDPDNPQIPEAICRPSEEIGYRHRSEYPILGIDYILSEADKKYHLLEINIPAVDPRDMGIDMLRPVTLLSPRTELLRRVAQASPLQLRFANPK